MVQSFIRRARGPAAVVTLAVAGVAGGVALNYRKTLNEEQFYQKHLPYKATIRQEPPARSEMLKNLGTKEYDVLIVGGGATGAGVALDAASRGLKVGLVERDDFASATSSRSTKLVHGGVRYLEKAVWNLDYEQYLLVKEALSERRTFLDMAPHLSSPLPIMIPLYKWWHLPYYWVGVKCYDLVAGRKNLESSYILSRGRALQAFPMLNDASLKGAMVYYDGSHNDSRTNVSLALTAVEKGADVLNHVEVVKLVKDEATGKINGAVARDRETDDEIKINAKCVVNATGPFSDALRQLDEGAGVQKIVIPSSGVHIVLPGWYSPQSIGLLDPATSDGRVLFFLPWQGSTLAGTTDTPCAIEENPIPSEKDIAFVLEEVKHYIDGKIDVRREDVKAAWSGIRPLVIDPAHAAKGGTQEVVRNHLVSVSNSGLVTVSGGKWTTFRQMAEDTVDTCVSQFGLIPQLAKAVTADIRVVGAEDWTPLRHIDLIQQYHLDPQVAKHLSESYGTCAFTVASLGDPNKRLDEEHPFVDSEIHYAVKYEYARTAVDFLARRTRLAFLDCKAAAKALPNVIDVMGKDLDWSEQKKVNELQDGLKFLKGMGLDSL